MTLDEWLHEEEQRLNNGIDSWKKYQENKENRENKAEIEPQESEG